MVKLIPFIFGMFQKFEVAAHWIPSVVTQPVSVTPTGFIDEYSSVGRVRYVALEIHE